MKEREDSFIERRIITGLIVSTEYVQQISKFWSPTLLASPTARLLSGWCFDHFNKYKNAPDKDIEGIFASKKETIPLDRADDIEGILSSLSEEYESDQFNVDYLLDETKSYLQKRHLKKFADDIKGALLSGSLTDAEKIAMSYSPLVSEMEYQSIDPFSSAQRIRRAFEEKNQVLITFPIKDPSMKVLGEFWNDQLTRDSFVAIMGPEKRGKTFMLIELAMRAMSSGCNVAFFQAGDMTENQHLKRLCIYHSKRSDKKKYNHGLWIPEVDCLKNQSDECNKTSEVRECNFGVTKEKKKHIGFDELTKLSAKNPEYKPCRNCREIEGTVWLKKRETTKPLTWKEAYQKIRKWQKDHNHKFRLCTYPNDTLCVSEIKSLLDIWERQDGFVPDVIVVDYADILAPDPDCTRLEYRHQQNKLWQRLRRLSQEKHNLVITATQAAASSYDKDSLKLSDFTDDKRKYAHVTAMYGLNQNDDEKKIGIMRLNKLVVREDDYVFTDQIKILQRLQIGRPFLGSYQ